MQILKILSGLACFALAALSLVVIALIGLAWLAQASAGAKTPGSAASILIGQWTLSGWQIYAVLSLLVVLTLAAIFSGVYAFKSTKTDD